MVESFAQYGRADAEEILNQLLAIPWFSSRKRQVYELIATYRHIIECLHEMDLEVTTPTKQQANLNSQVAKFITKFKELNEFGSQDEGRVKVFIDDPELMDETVNALFDSLEASHRQRSE